MTVERNSWNHNRCALRRVEEHEEIDERIAATSSAHTDGPDDDDDAFIFVRKLHQWLRTLCKNDVKMHEK